MQNIFFSLRGLSLAYQGLGAWAEPLRLCVCFSFYLIKTLNAHKRKLPAFPGEGFLNKETTFYVWGCQKEETR